MPTPNEELVRRILAKNGRGAACRRAVEDAWKAIRSGYPEKAWWRRKSTRAAVMWEHSVDNAVGALADDKEVRVIRHYDTTSVIIENTILLRFKKASIQLISANYPTPLATMFHTHEADLFGWEGLQRVELAHVFNRFETNLDWVGIIAREGRRILWHFEIDDGAGAVVSHLPLPKPVSPAGDRVLRPIKPGEEARDDGDE